MKSILFVLLLSPLCFSQVILLTGGDSSLMNSYGGKIKLYFPTSTYEVSGGTVNGRESFGVQSTTPYHGYDVHLGDVLLPLSLPTDMFQGFNPMGRGLLVERKQNDSDLIAFAGQTSLAQGTQFLNTSLGFDTTGLLFYRRSLSKRLKLDTLTVFGRKQTAIAGLTFDITPRLHAAFTTGIGTNSPFAAVRISGRASWGEISANYTVGSFHRAQLPTGLVSEDIGLNVLGNLHSRHLFASASSQHMTAVTNSAATQVTSSSISAGVVFFGMTAAAANVIGQVSGRSTFGQSYTLSGRIRGVDFQAGEFVSTTRLTTLTTSERVSHRIHLSQGVTYAGAFSGNIGGNYTGRRFSVDVSHQTLYFPLLAQFKQVTSLSVHVRLSGTLSVNADTVALPDGSKKWTAYGNEYLYGRENFAHEGSSISGGKYIVVGRVINKKGDGVEGACLTVGKTLVYTTQHGKFFVRRKKSGEVAISVNADSFVRGNWKIIDAPSHALAVKEGEGKSVVIVVEPI